MEKAREKAGSPACAGEQAGPVDLETAVATCEFGRFNYLLLVGLVFMCCSQFWEAGGLSFVMPSAECDLQLTEMQKGMINAAVFAGNIMAGMLWGIAGDKFGRMKILLITFLADFVFNVAIAFANVFWLILLLKILTGVVIAGPNSLVYTYVAETHSNQRRAQTVMLIGVGYGIAGVLHPVLAYLVLPLRLDSFPSWRVFLLLSAVPSLLSGLHCLLMPESPKFLFSQGRHDEGLRVLRRMFAANTGKRPEDYPYTSVVCGTVDAKRPSSDSTHGIGFMDQFKVALQRPYVTRLLTFIVIQMCMMAGVNSVRLWTPQLFAFLEQYDTLPEEVRSDAGGTICGSIGAVLASRPTMGGGSGDVCGRAEEAVSGDVYLRTLVIHSVHMTLFLLARPALKYIKLRTLVLFLFPSAAACTVALSWVGSVDLLTGLLSLYSPLTALAINALSSIQMDLFPTAIRGLAMSVVVTFGRVASLSGNLILAALLDAYCPVVFFYLSACLCVCFTLSWFIPHQKREAD